MAGSVMNAVDVTRLVERLAQHLHRSGATHPVAAAVSIACRGSTGRDIDAFAAWVGLPRSVVMACEAGDIAFADLPAEVVAEHGGLDLLGLADLDFYYASDGNV